MAECSGSCARSALFLSYIIAHSAFSVTPNLVDRGNFHRYNKQKGGKFKPAILVGYIIYCKKYKIDEEYYETILKDLEKV